MDTIKNQTDSLPSKVSVQLTQGRAFYFFVLSTGCTSLATGFIQSLVQHKVQGILGVEVILIGFQGGIEIGYGSIDISLTVEPPTVPQ